MKPLPSLAARPNLSHELAAALREMIFDGRLAAGARVNEVHLSAAMGVSRTPLREALSALVSEGALFSVARRGFIVRELTKEEAQSIYPIRALLDPEALRLSGLPDADQLAQMDGISDRLAKTKDVRRAITLDDDWHRAAWANCPNQVLVDLIEQFMQRTRRYELMSMRNSRILQTSAKSKTEITELLRRRQMGAACRRLRRSLEKGVLPVLDWLSQR